MLHRRSAVPWVSCLKHSHGRGHQMPLRTQRHRKENPTQTRVGWWRAKVAKLRHEVVSHSGRGMERDISHTFEVRNFQQRNSPVAKSPPPPVQCHSHGVAHWMQRRWSLGPMGCTGGGGRLVQVSSAKVQVEPLVDVPCLTPPPPESQRTAPTQMYKGGGAGGYTPHNRTWAHRAGLRTRGYAIRVTRNSAPLRLLQCAVTSWRMRWCTVVCSSDVGDSVLWVEGFPLHHD